MDSGRYLQKIMNPKEFVREYVEHWIQMFCKLSKKAFSIADDRFDSFSYDILEMLHNAGVRSFPPHLLNTCEPIVIHPLSESDSQSNEQVFFRPENQVNFRFIISRLPNSGEHSKRWAISENTKITLCQSLFLELQDIPDPLLIETQLYHDILSIWGSHESAPPMLNADLMKRNFERSLQSGFLNVHLLEEISTRLLLPHTVDRSVMRDMPKPRAALLWGPTGTGKTMMARLIMREAGVRPIWFGTAPELSNKWVGDTEKQIQSLFGESRKTPNLLCCVVIDEIDTLTAKRTSHQPDHKTDWLSLMLRIVGSDDYPNLLLIGTTNRKHIIDPAFLRPGRMDLHFFVGRLSRKERISLFDQLCRKHNLVFYDDLKLPDLFTTNILLLDFSLFLFPVTFMAIFLFMTQNYTMALLNHLVYDLIIRQKGKYSYSELFQSLLKVRRSSSDPQLVTSLPMITSLDCPDIVSLYQGVLAFLSRDFEPCYHFFPPIISRSSH